MGVCLGSGSPGTACSAGTSSALSIATFSAALTAQMLKVTTCSVSSVTIIIIIIIIIYISEPNVYKKSNNRHINL